LLPPSSRARIRRRRRRSRGGTSRTPGLGLPSDRCLPLWSPPPPAPPAAVLLRAGAGRLRGVALLVQREQLAPSGSRGHLLRRLVGDDAAAGEGLPAATEALVERHERERHRSLAGRQQVLLLDEELLGDQHRREVDGPFVVLLSREVDDLLRSGDALLQRRRTLDRAAVRRDGALDVGLRAEDGGRVVADELLVDGVLNAHVVRDAPVVEDRPAEGRAPEGLEAAALEELGGVLRVQVDRTDQRQVREQVRLRDPDLRALRRELPLAAPDVGATAQEIGRNAD